MKNLKLLRKQRGLGQVETAAQLNLTKSTYARYEIGETEPDLKTLMRIADYFGCSVDYLLGHKTQSILQLEGFTEAQRKIIELVSKLTPEQSWFVLGKISDVLELPYDSVKPVRPF